MKRIYMVRHCQAEGQSPEAPLTKEGVQAEDLADFFGNLQVDRIISSPFKRAIQTVQPFADRKQLVIETDARLEERRLSGVPLHDWLDKLKKTFDNPDLKFDGGESSAEAAVRIVSVVDEAFRNHLATTLIVTHGNLLALLLNRLDNQFGFEDWADLTNPDISCWNQLEMTCGSKG
ncbi:phosphoglycerate mutase [Sporosarcina sp. NCCP-2716]|uniref:histidine phosphatase family protein n=1 Tax=Sporosarcina sp. NCCP-2716 TaxID=2943679 RepID=UPI002040B530|nr:histidine phosphatase family protein [Sporosarcina sp. NCCP-2716]GKV68657.1 phosphoglycerate mutase [Sporosarcina sp. NCCP-2716]